MCVSLESLTISLLILSLCSLCSLLSFSTLSTFFLCRSDGFVFLCRSVTHRSTSPQIRTRRGWREYPNTDRLPLSLLSLLWWPVVGSGVGCGGGLICGGRWWVAGWVAVSGRGGFQWLAVVLGVVFLFCFV